MTGKSALCALLLEGHVVTVFNCAKETGLTNCGREIPRFVEQPFGVEVSRVPRTTTNRYGSTITYCEYRLNRSQRNLPGIALMAAYVEEQKKKRPVGRPKLVNTPPSQSNAPKLFPS